MWLLLLWASKFATAEIECCFTIIIEPNLIKKIHSEVVHYESCKKAFDWTLPI